ncbi:MAG TPA: helix-hairpin-helix domain-containing protein, partial [Bacteroidia bacterium]|nr:helix-hairpin-helix domain-containing protein [Bacteroidia bacterium]
MTNKEIARAFKLAGQLLELHDENPFKVRSFQNAAFKVERLPEALETMDAAAIAGIEGIGKSLQARILELKERGSFDELDELKSKTPEGILEILSIKGLGPKKVRTLWQELEIQSVGELLYACQENRLVTLKGFGEKT